MKNRFEIPQCETCRSRQISIFEELAPSDLAELSLHKGCNFHRAGQVLFYEGDQPSGIYCLNKGKVKLYKSTADGREQIVRLAKDGDVLGYRSLIAGEAYTSSAMVLEESTICFIPKSTFNKLLDDDPRTIRRLMKVLADDLSRAEDKLLSLSRKQVRDRLAETILLLREFFGLEADGSTLKASLSREDIANLMGSATETVIRFLSEFKDEGLIELAGKKIKILKPRKLLEIAQLEE